MTKLAVCNQINLESRIESERKISIIKATNN